TGPTFPSAPRTPTGVAGNGQVAVSWTPPLSNGGSASTDDQVWTYNAAGTTWLSAIPPCTTPNGTTLTCTVTGLTNGTGYKFTVTATNAVGDSAESVKTVTLTPTGPTFPSAPLTPTGVAGIGQVAVSWTPPTSN